MVEQSKGSNKVRLELYASKLKNVAGAFKGTSDPYAVVTLLANDPTEKPIVLGKTEVIKNTLSPKWTTSFDLNYEMGNMTRINVGIYDEVRKGTHKPMGSAMFEVGEVLGSRGNIKAKNLRNGGTLFARITPAPDQTQASGTLHLKVKGVKLANVDSIFGKSDPFFELNVKVDSAGGLSWQPIYRSKHIMNNLNPEWEEFAVDVSRLCGGDYNRPIQLKIFDWQKNGKHTAMGSFETSVNGFLNACVENSADTSKAFTVMKRGRQNAGQIVVLTARLEGGALTSSPMSKPPAPAPVATMPPANMSSSAPVYLPSDGGAFSQALDKPPSFAPSTDFSSSTPNAPITPMYDLDAIAPLPPPVAPSFSTQPFVSSYAPAAPMVQEQRRPKFVDYLSGGCELELCIAIDFTGSNGDPRRPGTLHYIHPDGQLNDYEKAITAVGSIIAKYDHDQKFTVWGFGAKYGGVIQHCFQVGNQRELPGISGVVEGYRSVFRSGLVMSGPTVFTEVIGMAAAKGRSTQEYYRRIGKQAYTVLLILTDGAVSDVEATKRAIEAASDAPLSIVIVGIGSADFSSMRFLDDFQSDGSLGRDICQFVEFSKFKDDRRALTRATLEEIPDQFVDYFFSRGIMPFPPVHGSQMSLDIEDAGEEDIDLNMNFGPDGEISLANYDGAVYDDTKYGTANCFTPSAPYRPSAPSESAPYQTSTSAPYQPSTSTQAPYVPSAAQTPQSYQSQPYQPQHTQFSASQYGNANVAPPPSQSYQSQTYQPQQKQPQQFNASQYGNAYVAPPPPQPTPGQRPNDPPPFSQALNTPYHGGGYDPLPQGGGQASGTAPRPTMQSQERLFHVRAPQGAHPGMQLQVQNPITGQQMLVTVPQGVTSGGLFAVRY